jgi:hypothetical protein
MSPTEQQEHHRLLQALGGISDWLKTGTNEGANFLVTRLAGPLDEGSFFGGADISRWTASGARGKVYSQGWQRLRSRVRWWAAEYLPDRCRSRSQQGQSALDLDSARPPTAVVDLHSELCEESPPAERAQLLLRRGEDQRQGRVRIHGRTALAPVSGWVFARSWV